MGDMVLDIVVIDEVGMRAGVVVTVVTVGSHIKIEVVVSGGSGMGPVAVFTCDSDISAVIKGTVGDVGAVMGAEVVGTVVLGGSGRDDEVGGTVVEGGANIDGLCWRSWTLLCVLFK